MCHRAPLRPQCPPASPVLSKRPKAHPHLSRLPDEQRYASRFVHQARSRSPDYDLTHPCAPRTEVPRPHGIEVARTAARPHSTPMQGLMIVTRGILANIVRARLEKVSCRPNWSWTAPPGKVRENR